jgi:hypothetical protein
MNRNIDKQGQKVWEKGYLLAGGTQLTKSGSLSSKVAVEVGVSFVCKEYI